METPNGCSCNNVVFTPRSSACSLKCSVCEVPLPKEGTEEASVIKHVIAALKDSVAARWTAAGNQQPAKKQSTISVWQSMIHPHLNGACTSLRVGTRKLFGVSSTVLHTALGRRGTLTHEQMDDDLISGASIATKTRSDKFPPELVYQYFHGGDFNFGSGLEPLPDYSALIEPDKSKKKSWSKKIFKLPDGTKKALNCQARFRRGTKAMCAREFLLSETYNRWITLHPEHSICHATIQKCMCACISPEKISECACPQCADIEVLLRATRKYFGNGCNNSECTDCLKWKRALISTESWIDQFSCPNEIIRGCRRTGSSEDFSIRPLRCCFEENQELFAACTKCVMASKLPDGTCSQFSQAKDDEVVTYLTRQPTVEGTDLNRIVSRLRNKEGKYSELVDLLFAKTKPYMQHLWRCRFLRRCFHLDCDYFDADTEAVILADFASQMVFGSGYKSTCESDSTCNLYVVLVLYKNKLPDGKYETKCDYIRIWSPASSSAAFHHKALQDAIAHLKQGNKVPGLKRVRIWTDGDSSTYKGFPNFGRMAEFTADTLIEIIHCFFESAHASGVQDSAGKDPRIRMMKAIGFKQESIYNYYACQEWCLKNMRAPDQSVTREGGHFIANGEYVWWAYSDGRDEFKDRYPVIDLARKEFNTVKGSSSMFEFSTRCDSPQALIARSLPCRCVTCRNRGSKKETFETLCPYLHMTGQNEHHTMKRTKTFTIEETQQRKSLAKALRQEKLKKKISELTGASAIAVAAGSVANQNAAFIADQTGNPASYGQFDAMTVAQDGGGEQEAFPARFVDVTADMDRGLEAEDELCEDLESKIIEGMLMHCTEIRTFIKLNGDSLSFCAQKEQVLLRNEKLEEYLRSYRGRPRSEQEFAQIGVLSNDVDESIAQLREQIKGDYCSSGMEHTSKKQKLIPEG